MTKKAIGLIIATTCGCGYSPFASGTVGSLAAMILYGLLMFLHPLVYMIICIGLFFIGTWATKIAQHHFQKKDPSHVVIDEVVGQLITFAFIPIAAFIHEERFILTIILLVAGFLLFRAFDIFKPQPARWADRRKDAWGVMLDDVFAGIYANLGVWMIMYLEPFVNDHEWLFLF